LGSAQPVRSVGRPARRTGGLPAVILHGAVYDVAGDGTVVLRRKYR
jgi:hypothetical protein